jgi:hypothetical protein
LISAPYVQFFYRIQVRRERQLNAHNAIVERLTLLTSDVLVYDLDRNNVRTTPPQTKGKISVNLVFCNLRQKMFKKDK